MTGRHVQPRGIRICWTGARHWVYHADLLAEIVRPVADGIIEGCPGRPIGWMHGAAVGLDNFIAHLSRHPDFRDFVVPEVYPVMPGESPLQRDLRMIEKGMPDVVIGVPHVDSTTGGTWTTLRYADRACIPAYLLREVRGHGYRLMAYQPNRPRVAPHQARTLF